MVYLNKINKRVNNKVEIQAKYGLTYNNFDNKTENEVSIC